MAIDGAYHFAAITAIPLCYGRPME